MEEIGHARLSRFLIEYFSQRHASKSRKDPTYMPDEGHRGSSNTDRGAVEEGSLP